MSSVVDPKYALALAGGSAIATAILIWMLKPWLQRYALARPNARSSHTIPTPQGGGAAIVIAIVTVAASSAIHGVPAFQEPWVFSVLVALVALAIAGGIDDVSPLPVLPRLALQIAVAALLVQTLPGDVRVLPMVPQLAEYIALTIALVWFVNLTNFMDGIDWMMVVEVVPISACLTGLGMFGIVPELTRLLPVLLALSGAILGFAPFNRHVARLFLGDVGSLPLGVLLGWLLIVLAGAGHWQAAAILPLYFTADATITLLRRASRREDVSQAHRSHFYQRAVGGGFSVPYVTGMVLLLNLMLAGLAVRSILTPTPLHANVCLAIGLGLTLALLAHFQRGRRG